MEFKGPYLMAMRERAPAMFNDLRRSGDLDAHVQKRAVQAQQAVMAGMQGHDPKDLNRLRMVEETEL